VPAPTVSVRTAMHVGELSTVKQLLRILFFRGHPQPNVIAVYELEQTQRGCVYRHVGSGLESEEPLDRVIELVDGVPVWPKNDR